MDSTATPHILLVAVARDLHHVDDLRRQLVRRGFTVTLSVYGASLAAGENWSPSDTHVIAVLPRSSVTPGDEQLDDALRVIRRDYSGFDLTLVVRPGQEPTAELTEISRQIVVDLGVDAVLRDVLQSILSPSPGWLDAWFAVRHVVEPAGVAWLAGGLLVADAHREHVVQLDRDGGTTVVLPGLSEPHDLALDRRQLFLANTGDDTVVTARLRHGQAATVRELSVGDLAPPGLRRPHSAGGRDGVVAIADTGGNRVVVRGRGDRAWHVVDEVAPAGVALDDGHLWIADRGAGVVDVYRLTPAPQHLLRFGRDVLHEPVAVVRWRDVVVVAEAGSSLLQRFRVATTATGDVTVEADGHLAIPYCELPTSLSVDPAGRLAVADQVRGCIWIVALAEAR